MNWKKLSVYSILLFVFVMPLVMAAEITFTNALQWLLDKVTPAGSAVVETVVGFSTGTAQILGFIALIITFVILLDLALLVLPFGKTTSWIIAVGLTIGALLVGVIKTIAGWGLALGSLIAGGAGVLAIVMSAVTMFAALIALFFGGNKIMAWLKDMKVRREGLEKIYEAKGKGFKIKAAREQENTAAGV